MCQIVSKRDKKSAKSGKKLQNIYLNFATFPQMKREVELFQHHPLVVRVSSKEAAYRIFAAYSNAFFLLFASFIDHQ